MLQFLVNGLNLNVIVVPYTFKDLVCHIEFANGTGKKKKKKAMREHFETIIELDAGYNGENRIRVESNNEALFNMIRLAIKEAHHRWGQGERVWLYRED